MLDKSERKVQNPFSRKLLKTEYLRNTVVCFLNRAKFKMKHHSWISLVYDCLTEFCVVMADILACG